MSSSTQTDIQSAVKGFLTQHFQKNDWDIATLKEETELFDSGLLDSLALAELVLHVEKTVGIEIDFLLIDPEELSTMTSLSNSFETAAIIIS